MFPKVEQPCVGQLQVFVSLGSDRHPESFEVGGELLGGEVFEQVGDNGVGHLVVDIKEVGKEGDGRVFEFSFVLGVVGGVFDGHVFHDGVGWVRQPHRRRSTTFSRLSCCGLRFF